MVHLGFLGGAKKTLADSGAEMLYWHTDGTHVGNVWQIGGRVVVRRRPKMRLEVVWATF